MSDATDASPLRGKLLIAMPGMGDPRFEQSVVFLCDHSGEGAMGLIVNKPTPAISFADLAAQLQIDTAGLDRDLPVHFGGPVETGRGFVLHSRDYPGEGKGATLEVDDSFAMTATLDVLQDIVLGQGPQRAIFALGYAGWGPGQLEAEIQQNGWLTCDAAPDIVFAADTGGKWAAALQTLGVSAISLSAAAGRA